MNPRLPYVPTIESHGRLWALCVIVLAVTAGGYVLAGLVGAANF